MKIAQIAAAAGLVIASLSVPNAADAQRYDGDRSGSYDRDYRDHHRDDRRDYRDGRRDNGRHYGWTRGRGHQRCWIEYRHRHEVRVCR